MTLRLKVWCSTDWANQAAHKQLCGNENVHTIAKRDVFKKQKGKCAFVKSVNLPCFCFCRKLFRYVTRRYKSIQMCVKYQTCSLDLRLKRLQPNRTSNSFHCLTCGAIALRSGDLIKLPYLSTFFSWSYSLARTKHRCTGNTIYCLRSP